MSRVSAIWAQRELVPKTRRARVLVAAVVLAAATFIATGRRHPSQPATAAPEVQHEAVTASAARPTTTPASASKPATTPASETTRVASTAATQGPRALTITGCLERDDQKFRLTNTEGENAPRSRSWRTGFLTKRNRSVDVVDSSNRFRLPDHVGERVTASGALVDGNMQLRSLRRVAMSCEKEA